MIMEEYEKEISDYCVKNGLSASKVFGSAMAYNDVHVSLVHYVPSKVKKKILTIGGPPLPVTLEIYLENGKLRFEQTEHTHHLAEEHETAQMAFG
jgi:hypothetical protein